MSSTLKWLLVILIVLVLGGVGFAAWWFFLGGNKGDKETAQEPPAVESKYTCTQAAGVDTSGWQEYTNNEVGYKLKYPQGWVAQPVNETSEYSNKPVKYLVLANQAEKTSFTLGLKKKGVTAFEIWDRTGISAGDTQDMPRTCLLGAQIFSNKLVFEGKTKEFFYSSAKMESANSSEDVSEDCNCEFSGYYGQPDEDSDYKSISLSDDMVTVPNQILATVEWLQTEE